MPRQWLNIPISALLNHTSGIPEYFLVINQQVSAPQSFEHVIKALGEKEPVFEFNTQVQYTQINYLLIGALLESVTGQSYESLVQERLLTPLMMSNTYLKAVQLPRDVVPSYLPNSGDKIKPNKYVFPSYGTAHTGIYSTAYDLNLFLSSLMEGKLVDKAILIKLWRPQKLLNGQANFFVSGWDYEKEGDWHSVGHDGGALLRVSAFFNAEFSDYMVVSYLTNGNLDGVWSRSLVKSLQQYWITNPFSRLLVWAGLYESF